MLSVIGRVKTKVSFGNETGKNRFVSHSHTDHCCGCFQYHQFTDYVWVFGKNLGKLQFSKLWGQKI
ncbi:MAG: hypothetical protein Ct9H300mP21_09940 [Pseudomonadota bacterium]|nr:MAG: hypothetical protein Ct9H300mP21_09940 [Pseudomonadota bacterium]